MKNVLAFLAGLAASVTAGLASAAVDAGVATAMATVQADALSLAGIVTPVVIVILGAGIGIKLIKRFGNKI
jgi:hypothetical protein